MIICYRPNPPYGNRGKSVETITSEGKTGFNKFLTKSGRVLSFVSLGIGAYDMLFNHYEHYKLADFTIGAAFLTFSYISASALVPGLALAYYSIDMAVQYYTGNSITQNIQYKLETL